MVLRIFYRSLRLFALLFLFICTVTPSLAASQTQQPPDNGISYSTLANILKNDKSRARLISELQTLAKQQAAASHGPQTKAPAAQSGASAENKHPVSSDQSGTQESLPRRIADDTQAFAETLGEKISAAGAAIEQLSEPGQGPGIDMNALGHATLDLLLVIVATFILLLILRRIVRPLFSRAGCWARSDGARSVLLRRTVAVAWSLVIDVAVIFLAAIGGYALALFTFGVHGAVDTRQSLFINAFVLVEIFKAFIRMVFAPDYDGLRVFSMRAEVAAYWNAWLARLSGFIGYGMLVAVPIVSFNISLSLSQFLGLLIMAIAYIYAITVIVKNRALLRSRLKQKADNAATGFGGVLLRILARTWHLWALAYFTVLFVLSQARPGNALPFMMLATLQTLLIIGGGFLLSAILAQLIGRRVELGEDMRRRMPMLEKRVNSYIPTALKIIRLIILILAVVLVCNAWHVFNLSQWLQTDAGAHTVITAAKVLIILAIAGLLWIAVASFLEHRLSPETGRGEPSAREKTLVTLIGNALAITFITITLMITLSQIGINIGPLIASAGVLGLAIGFGAQKLVQDIITGVFIQLENAMNTGDVVTIAGTTGTVERLTVRSAGIRDLSGTYHVVPFSAVGTVSNYMRGFGYHVGEYGVAYRENTDEVITHLQAAFDELITDEAQAAKIIGELEVFGVTNFGDSDVKVRVRIKTSPGNQWGVGREYNRLVKKHFDAAGIEIPFPHLTLYFGEDKDGKAPPAHLALENSPFALGGGDGRRTPAEQDANGDKTWGKSEADEDASKIPSSKDVDD